MKSPLATESVELGSFGGVMSQQLPSRATHISCDITEKPETAASCLSEEHGVRAYNDQNHCHQSHTVTNLLIKPEKAPLHRMS